MKSMVKRWSTSIIVAVLLTGTCINASASANFDSNSYASFEWDESSCTIKNITNTDRYMTANFEVYEKNTGKRIGNKFADGNGTYGKKVTANNPIGQSSMHRYKWIGGIYNSAHPYSGTVASFEKP